MSLIWKFSWYNLHNIVKGSSYICKWLSIAQPTLIHCDQNNPNCPKHAIEPDDVNDMDDIDNNDVIRGDITPATINVGNRDEIGQIINDIGNRDGW